MNYRRYGTKCNGCLQGICPTDLVRKARDKVFHLNCFTCLVCRKQLSTGEELYVLDDNKFVCKQDYLSGKPMPDVHHAHGHHGKSTCARALSRFPVGVFMWKLRNKFPCTRFKVTQSKVHYSEERTKRIRKRFNDYIAREYFFLIFFFFYF